jgi:hypothetical protein
LPIEDPAAETHALLDVGCLADVAAEQDGVRTRLPDGAAECVEPGGGDEVQVDVGQPGQVHDRVASSRRCCTDPASQWSHDGHSGDAVGRADRSARSRRAAIDDPA